MATDGACAIMPLSRLSRLVDRRIRTPKSPPTTRSLATQTLLRPHRYALFSPTMYEWRVDTLPTLPTYVLYVLLFCYFLCDWQTRGQLVVIEMLIYDSTFSRDCPLLPPLRARQ